MKMNLLEAIAWVEERTPGIQMQSDCGKFRLALPPAGNAGVYLTHIHSEFGWSSSSLVGQAAKATWTRPRRKADYLEALRAVNENRGRAFYDSGELYFYNESPYIRWKNGGYSAPSVDASLGEWEIEDAEGNMQRAVEAR